MVYSRRKDKEVKLKDIIGEDVQSMYFRRDGTPYRTIHFQKGMELRRVAETHLWWGGWVSTVWLGLNHNWGFGPPLIFESMLFGPNGYGDLDINRYSTETEAKAGHERMVKYWKFRLRKIAWIYIQIVMNKLKASKR